MNEYTLACEVHDLSAEQAIILADSIKEVVKMCGLDVELHILNKKNMDTD